MCFVFLSRKKTELKAKKGGIKAKKVFNYLICVLHYSKIICIFIVSKAMKPRVKTIQ